MITIRAGEERGHGHMDWLDSRFSFSFDQYYDPAHMGFGSLRVINEDRIAQGKGFGTHPHRDMEILTYVLEGALEHRDSIGTTSVIRPGELQKMSAGTGVTHSEFNYSTSEPVHLLQIWIVPERTGLKPAYEQHTFSPGELDGGFHLVAGPQGIITIHQDANLYAAKLAPGTRTTQEFAPGRQAWLQVARGRVQLNASELKAGDGAAITGERKIDVLAQDPAELLLFDMA